MTCSFHPDRMCLVGVGGSRDATAPGRGGARFPLQRTARTIPSGCREDPRGRRRAAIPRAVWLLCACCADTCQGGHMSTASRPTPPRALLFDVFGTCVDWRASIARQAAALGSRYGLDAVAWEAFADAWRARYRPQMDTVRTGMREWATPDVLHRESLDDVLAAFGIDLRPDDR